MRPLSAYEGIIAARTNKGLYNNFIVGAEYLTPLSKETLLNALASLLQQFPHFSLRIKKYSSIVALPYNVDGSYIDVLPTGTPADICAKYTLHRFEYTKLDKPLFKIIYVIDINTVFFVADHVYFDGTAGKNFHLHLSEALMKGGEIDKFIDTTKFYQYPNPTKLMKFKEREPNSTKISEASFRPPINKALLNTPPPVHNSTILHLSSEETKKLLDCARKNNTKLTSLLYSLGAKTLLKVLNDVSHTNTKFKAMIPINTRSKIDITEDDNYNNVIQFGMFFGKYFDEEDPEYIKRTDVFELSRKFQSNLSASIIDAMNDFEIVETFAKSDFLIIEKNIDGLMESNHEPNSTYVMSNLGVLNSLIIGKMYFDQPMVDGSFGLHLISSTQGGLAMNFTSHRGIPNNIYQNYVDCLSSEIISYCRL
jgi:hypothetical protein